jgi:hypothetical protein
MPEAPVAPAKGPEINLFDTPPVNEPATLPDSILEAAMAMTGAEPPAKPEPKPDPAKPVAQKPPEKPAPAPKPAPEVPKKKEGIDSVREALDRQTAKAEELASSLTATAKEKADAFAKVAELERQLKERDEKIAKEYEPRLAVLTEKEKRLQQAEEQIRIRDYTLTPEYHEKYVTPIIEAQAEAQALISELVVTDGDGAQHAATREHFDYVISAPNQNEAAKRAEQLFGPHVASSVANFRLRLRALESKRQEAQKNAALESIEYEKRSAAQIAQQRENLLKAVAERESKYIEEFAPPVDDADLIEAFRKGKELVDEVAAATPDMGLDKFADTIARARTAMRKAPILAKKAERLQARVAELEEQLKAYQASEPTVETRRTGGDPTDGEESWKDELLKKAKELATSY